MHSDMIGKIEKARQYAQEPERIHITELQANFHGSNTDHQVTLTNGQWSCNTSSASNRSATPHIMAMQRLLEPMLAPEARQPEELEGVHMPSEMISKIEKARQYTQEPERVQINTLKAQFRGSNSTHTVSLSDGQWHCDCAFFGTWGTCQHIMAIQRVLDTMLVPEARQPEMAIDIQNEAALI